MRPPQIHRMAILGAPHLRHRGAAEAMMLRKKVSRLWKQSTVHVVKCLLASGPQSGGTRLAKSADERLGQLAHSQGRLCCPKHVFENYDVRRWPPPLQPKVEPSLETARHNDLQARFESQSLSYPKSSQSFCGACKSTRSNFPEDRASRMSAKIGAETLSNSYSIITIEGHAQRQFGGRGDCVARSLRGGVSRRI